MRTFQFIEGFMPLQFLLELMGIVLLFTGVALVLERAGHSINRFSKTVLVFITFVLYLTLSCLPPDTVQYSGYLHHRGAAGYFALGVVH